MRVISSIDTSDANFYAAQGIEDSMRATERVPRIHHRFMLKPAAAQDTAEYVAFRLKGAGADHELFTSESLAAVQEPASGSLRESDRLASAALRESARRKRKLVERDVVARVAEALTLSSSLGETTSRSPRGSSATSQSAR